MDHRFDSIDVVIDGRAADLDLQRSKSFFGGEPRRGARSLRRPRDDGDVRLERTLGAAEEVPERDASTTEPCVENSRLDRAERALDVADCFGRGGRQAAPTSRVGADEHRPNAIDGRQG